jgi:S-formylglutathione hydrolase FrmB
MSSSARVIATVILAFGSPGICGAQTSGLRFAITFPASTHAAPVTGRAFLILSRDSSPAPRFEIHPFDRGLPIFGRDVNALAPGKSVLIDATVPGYPLKSLADLPPGDYYAQAVLNVYTEFHRADGHIIWAHMDQWEGQQFVVSPGNLYSVPQKIRIDSRPGGTHTLVLTQTIPPRAPPADTKWVKQIKIQSKLLSAFWGRPIYLGASVLLPAGYDDHPGVHYPVIYNQAHFGLRPPLRFAENPRALPGAVLEAMADNNLDTPADFSSAWSGPDFPRMIAILFQHPTPYFDDSYAVNSANNGPYGDAILTELIPYLEQHFRIIAKPYARVLTGGSTGGWESLALQIFHPEFFGGTWTGYPDPVDFRHYGTVDIYADTNAFVVTRRVGAFLNPSTEWQHPERYIMRAENGQPMVTMREYSRWEDVLGSHGRSTDQLEAWESVYGPVGEDGYPKPLWDKRTGHIDHDVAMYMRDHGFDLRYYLARHWPAIGPQLVGKIHVDVGDMDNFYLNLAVYDLQAFLDSVSTPRAQADVRYGRPEKGHGWQHTSEANLVREMADFITAHAPAGGNSAQWKY